MNKLLSLQQGKKTYAIVAISVVLGVIQGLHDYHYINFEVPGFVMWILGFAGIGAVRMGIKNQAAATTENMLALIGQVMASLEAPPEPTPPTQDESKVTADLNKGQLDK